MVARNDKAIKNRRFIDDRPSIVNEKRELVTGKLIPLLANKRNKRWLVLLNVFLKKPFSRKSKQKPQSLCLRRFTPRRWSRWIYFVC